MYLKRYPPFLFLIWAPAVRGESFRTRNRYFSDLVWIRCGSAEGSSSPSSARMAASSSSARSTLSSDLRVRRRYPPEDRVCRGAMSCWCCCCCSRAETQWQPGLQITLLGKRPGRKKNILYKLKYSVLSKLSHQWFFTMLHAVVSLTAQQPLQKINSFLLFPCCLPESKRISFLFCFGSGCKWQQKMAGFFLSPTPEAPKAIDYPNHFISMITLSLINASNESAMCSAAVFIETA